MEIFWRSCYSSARIVPHIGQVPQSRGACGQRDLSYAALGRLLSRNNCGQIICEWYTYKYQVSSSNVVLIRLLRFPSTDESYKNSCGRPKICSVEAGSKGLQPETLCANRNMFPSCYRHTDIAAVGVQFPGRIAFVCHKTPLCCIAKSTTLPTR